MKQNLHDKAFVAFVCLVGKTPITEDLLNLLPIRVIRVIRG